MTLTSPQTHYLKREGMILKSHAGAAPSETSHPGNVALLGDPSWGELSALKASRLQRHGELKKNTY